MRQRILAVGAAGIAAGERDIAFLDALGCELQVIVGVQRLAVIVDAHEGGIQIVAREGEIVRVAAEERDAFFGREHHAHILVALVLVQIVDAAVVERHDLAAHVRAPCRTRFRFSLWPLARPREMRGPTCRPSPPRTCFVTSVISTN